MYGGDPRRVPTPAPGSARPMARRWANPGWTAATTPTSAPGRPSGCWARRCSGRRDRAGRDRPGSRPRPRAAGAPPRRSGRPGLGSSGDPLLACTRVRPRGRRAGGGVRHDGCIPAIPSHERVARRTRAAGRPPLGRAAAEGPHRDRSHAHRPDAPARAPPGEHPLVAASQPEEAVDRGWWADEAPLRRGWRRRHPSSPRPPVSAREPPRPCPSPPPSPSRPLVGDEDPPAGPFDDGVDPAARPGSRPRAGHGWSRRSETGTGDVGDRRRRCRRRDHSAPRARGREPCQARPRRTGIPAGSSSGTHRHKCAYACEH